MKKMITSLMISAVMLTAGSAAADWLDDFIPIIGLDYYQVLMKSRNGWSHIYPKSYAGGTLYIGGMISPCFGFEVGYDSSVNKNRSWGLSNGRNTLDGTTKVRRFGGHLDLIGFLPIDRYECFNAFGSVGYGYVTPKIAFTPNHFTGPDGRSRAFDLQATSGKGGSVLRLGLGVNYMISSCIGVRAKIGFESTSTLRLKDNAAVSNAFSSLTQKAFKNSATFAFGSFVRF